MKQSVNSRVPKCLHGWLPVLLTLVVFCSSGATCSRNLRRPFAQVGPPAPEVLVPGAGLDQVLAAVNQNATRIQNYQTTNASITVPGMATLPLLRGNIAAERPGRMRLQASTTISGSEVDLGSNDELFWFWVKRNEPPALYFARHDRFVGSAAQQVMPIEPSWLLDALGFAQFNPSDFHEGPIPHGNGTLEIRSVLQTRIGTITKTTVVDAKRAWVLEQYLYDARGTLLASAVARSHQYYPAQNISLPQEIDIRLPVAQLAMTVDVGTVQLNQPAMNPAIWQMPVLTGYQQVDLGSAQPNTLSAIGAPGSGDWNTWASPSTFGIEPASGVIPATPGEPPFTNYVLPPEFTGGQTPQVANNQTPAATAPPTATPVGPPAQPLLQHLPPGGIPVSGMY